jgi:hypothetical protein
MKNFFSKENRNAINVLHLLFLFNVIFQKRNKGRNIKKQREDMYLMFLFYLTLAPSARTKKRKTKGKQKEEDQRKKTEEEKGKANEIDDFHSSFLYLLLYILVVFKGKRKERNQKHSMHILSALDPL